jgi:methyltransferase (TIGR00027 family)
MIVAAARAAAGVDPIASRLAPRALVRVVGAASFGLVEHLRIRTRAIDEALIEATAGGVRQVVVLGAGLDARAWRMDELAATTVFEVDHPSTQALKKKRIGDAPLRARAIELVGVDFERDDLEACLARAGHDAAAPTFWIWEGVTPYLTPAAIEATIAIAARRSAPESVLAMTYGTPRLASVPRPMKRVVGPAFRILGEPLRGLMPIERAHELVREHGFAVIRDESIADLARRYAIPMPWWLISEQILFAAKR